MPQAETNSGLADDVQDIKSTQATVWYFVDNRETETVEGELFYKESTATTWQGTGNRFAVDAENIEQTREILTGLSPETTYDLKTVVFEEGTTTEIQSSEFIEEFTTTSLIVHTQTATDVGDTSFTANGQIVDVGEYTSVYGYFAWREEGGTWEYVQATDELAVTGETPDEFSDNVLWNDPNENITIENNEIAEWGDKSIADNDLEQPWDAKPELVDDEINGEPVVRFRQDGNLHSDAGSYPYNMSDQNPVLGNSFTLFTVVHCPDATHRNGIWGQWRDGEQYRIFGEVHADGEEGKLRMYYDASDDGSYAFPLVADNTDVNTTDYFIITWQKDIDNFLKIFVNGSLVAERDLDGVDVLQKSFSIGEISESGGLSSDVDYAYLAAHNTALNKEDRSSVESYLSDRFDIDIEQETGISLPVWYDESITLLDNDKKYEYKAVIYDGDSQEYIGEGNIMKVPGLGYSAALEAPFGLEDNNDNYYYGSLRKTEDYSQLKNAITLFEPMNLYEEVRIDEDTTEVIIRDPGDFLSTYVEDQESINTYGKKELMRETDIERAPGQRRRLESKAEALLERYKDPQTRIEFTTPKPGLKPGQRIDIKSTKRDIDDTFTIQEVNFRLKNQSEFVYDVTAVNYKPLELLDFIKQLG